MYQGGLYTVSAAEVEVYHFALSYNGQICYKLFFSFFQSNSNSCSALVGKMGLMHGHCPFDTLPLRTYKKPSHFVSKIDTHLT